jgi:membrane protein
MFIRAPPLIISYQTAGNRGFLGPAAAQRQKRTQTMSNTRPTESQGSLTCRWRRVRQVLRDSLANFFREDSLAVSAGIAYHSLLCIFPLLLLLVSLSGFYIQRHELTGRLAIVLGRYLPMRPDFIMQNLAGISQAYGRVGFFSLLLLLWSSSGVFLPLEKALNRAWEVEKGRSWWGRHLLALEMALIIGFLILLSSAVVGVNVYVHNWLRRGGHSFPSPWFGFAYHFLIIGVMFGLTLAMFILLFKRLPNRPMSFRHVLPGALLTAIFWEAARSFFTLLLPVFNYRHVYGSIGVVVALMTWAYVSSAVTLFGAQVSRALYRTLRINGPIVEGVPIAPAAQSAGEVP